MKDKDTNDKNRQREDSAMESIGFGELIAKHVRPLAPVPTGAVPSGKIDVPVRCVLLDVYGTLVVSAAGDIGLSGPGFDPKKVESPMREYGVAGSPEELKERLAAEIRREHERMRNKGVDFPEVDIVGIWEKVLHAKDLERTRAFALEYELTVNPVYPMPDFHRFIEECRKRGVKLGLVSNAQFYTPLILEFFLENSLENAGFDPRLLFFSYKCGHAKPSRRMFGLAAAELEKRGISRENVLYVGNDMLNDMAPAAAEGFKTALFAGDRRSLRMREGHPDVGGLQPDTTVVDLMRIIDHVALRKEDAK
jgi:putative hydrolase of the HAD superfamily